MATWQYRCVSCGSVHEAPLRPGGVVYLRCVVTRQWAWHDPSRFAEEAAETPAPRRRTVRAAAVHARASTTRRLSAVRTVRRKAAARRTPRGRRRR